MQRTTVFLSDPQREALDKIAKASGSPVAQHIRQAIDQYLAGDTARFLVETAERQTDRVVRGVPMPTILAVEKTVFFRFLAPEQQDQIRRAETEDEKHTLLSQFIDATSDSKPGSPAEAAHAS